MSHFCQLCFKTIFLTVMFGMSALSVAETDTIFVEDAYVRGLPPSVKNTSAYMTIKNSSNEERQLVGAETDIAAAVMIHRTENRHGLMTMDHKMSVIIPAHGEALLTSGATHLMIMGLKAPIAPSALVDITLLFQNGDKYTVTMPVRSVLDE